jgi:hypothetical protein
MRTVGQYSPISLQLGLLMLAACSDPAPGTPNGSGGSAGRAGAASTSGGTGGSTVVASGGSTVASGGTPTGGVSTTGGVTATGGTSGGAGSGGKTNGGAGAAGGSGGSKNSGGAGGTVGAAGNAGNPGGGVSGGGGTGGSSGGLGGVPNGGGAGKGGGAGSGGTADSVAASIDKFRFECPCKPGAADHSSDGNCNVTPETDRQTIVKTMGGDATKVYDVTLRVRGLTEPNTYRNGMLQGERFYIGGTTNSPGYTSYMMTVADPAQHYFFNYSPTTGHTHFKLDYQVTVKIRGGSRVTFDVDGDGSVPDGHQVSNFDEMVVPGVAPDPDWYDGQFVQLDVVSVEVAP